MDLRKAGYADTAYIWWYDPRDGKFYTSDGKETENAQKMIVSAGKLQAESPEAGKEKDWVLIVKKEDGENPICDKVYFDAEKEGQLKKVFVW